MKKQWWEEVGSEDASLVEGKVEEGMSRWWEKGDQPWEQSHRRWKCRTKLPTVIMAVERS